MSASRATQQIVPTVGQQQVPASSAAQAQHQLTGSGAYVDKQRATKQHQLVGPSSSNREAYQRQQDLSNQQNRGQSYSTTPTLRNQRSRLHQQPSGGSSTTPSSSRPASSALGGTVSAADSQRATSSCSTTVESNATPQGQDQQQSSNIGKCRICRKLITANEPYHLCSYCNQFVCEDCASYSSTDQVSLLVNSHFRSTSLMFFSNWLVKSTNLSIHLEAVGN